MPLWRAEGENIYHYCSRCGRRMPLEELEWQAAQLFCRWSDCVDTAIVGSRDLAVARQVAIDRKELQPDPKIYQVKDPVLDLEQEPPEQ
jgi:hypothetical protein